MTSIRNQLLGWILPSFLALYCLAALSLFQAEKTSLMADLTDQLNHLVTQVKRDLTRSLPRRGAGDKLQAIIDLSSNTALEKRLNQISEVKSNRPIYFQLTDENGTILFKSASLESNIINRPDIKIVRQKSRTEPLVQPLNTHIKLVSQTLFLPDRRARQSYYLSLALDDVAMQRKLTKLTRRLLIGGIFSGLLFSSILIFILRKTFRPISTLASSVSSINTDTLEQRFSTDKMPSEIKPLVEKLNELMARIELSFDRERRFSSDLAHEIRTPLAAIRSTAEVARKWPTDTIKEDLAEIESLSSQMQVMVDSLLMLARLESKQITAHIGDSTQTSTQTSIQASTQASTRMNTQTVPQNCAQKIDVLKLVQSSLKLRHSECTAKSVRVTTNLNKLTESDKGLWCIDTDHSLLQMIISNLLGNAISHAPDNSDVLIEFNTDLHTSQQLRYIKFRNLAPSLTQDDIPKLFERFWQHDAARQLNGHSGLGLSITQRCVALLEYQLNVSLEKVDDHQWITFQLSL